MGRKLWFMIRFNGETIWGRMYFFIIYFFLVRCVFPSALCTKVFFMLHVDVPNKV